MDLSRCMNDQVYLNSILKNTPHYNQLNLAVIAELGEYVQAIKPMWCWWPKRNEATHQAMMDEARGELVDVLHFLLTGMIQDDPNGITYAQAMVDERRNYPDLRFQTDLVQAIGSVIRESRMGRWKYAIGEWSCLWYLHLSEEEFDHSWRVSYDKNIARWQ